MEQQKGLVMGGGQLNRNVLLYVLILPTVRPTPLNGMDPSKTCECSRTPCATKNGSLIDLDTKTLPINSHLGRRETPRAGTISCMGNR